MNVLVGISSAGATLTLIGILAFLSRNWILERLKLSLQKEHSEFLDKLSWDRKIKEQAAKVAEYLAFVNQLSEDDPKERYIRANQMSWELAMWLPEEIYREATNAIVNRSEKCNELTTIISVRKLLLKEDAGNLDQNNIAVHGPGIGKKDKNKKIKEKNKGVGSL